MFNNCMRVSYINIVYTYIINTFGRDMRYNKLFKIVFKPMLKYDILKCNF